MLSFITTSASASVSASASAGFGSLTLAQAGGSDQNICALMTDVFSRPDTLAHPGPLMHNLQSLSVVWAVVFVIAGVVCLLNGYKLYRWVTVIAGLLLGILAGYYLGQKIQAEAIVAGCLGLLAGVLCLPLMKYAVAAMGGLAGAFIGANAWSSIARLAVDGQAGEQAAANFWVGALMGLIVFGMLSFIVFKFSVVIFTTVSGSTLAVMGLVALLLQVPAWRGAISDHVTAHAAIVPILVFVPALIGMILQQTRSTATAKPAS